ncbi:hypothetical protein HNP38_001224 [Chryseobacterium defluvii]|uniref:Uncharacterized protein n=1 Tax=Chryseobacterium defluvii TaxID=160396 RepID=A0A840KG98_9FLAO|nr:hypothetical protein [Chryseobacterium defluvii]MBB4805952.1 hypothetical protein [Chryseobacterium defluvii]
MKAYYFILFFVFNNVCSQESNNQFYFIGEKIEEHHRPYASTYIPAERKDCIENEEDDRCHPKITKPYCMGGGEYYSKYRIIKILKGRYINDTIEFSSEYCNEFGYRRPLKGKYAIIGILTGKDGLEQNYIEKVYYKTSKWILPYKTSYPFINYSLIQPQKFKNSQRVKLNISEEYYQTLCIVKYNKPYYKEKRKYALALYGFIL